MVFTQEMLCSERFRPIGMRFVCMQPANDDVSMAAMICEMAGGDCGFMRDPPKYMSNQIIPSLNLVCFGIRRYKGYETRLHSYLVEGFARDYGLSKCSHYLWVMRNRWATDQYALVFLINYNGDNGLICIFQMRIMMMHVYIVHSNVGFVGGDDYGSCEAGDMWFYPLIFEHNALHQHLEITMRHQWGHCCLRTCRDTESQERRVAKLPLT